MKRIALLGLIIPVLVWSCDKKEEQEQVKVEEVKDKDSIEIQKPPYERYGDFVISNIKGEENITCTRTNYCSVGKTISNDVIYREEDNTIVVINAKILGGYKELSAEDEEKIMNGEEVQVELKETIWNDKPHNVLVICSKKTPMVGDKLISDLFSEYGLAYAGVSTAEFYLSKCHSDFNNQEMEIEAKFERLGYNFKNEY